MSNTLLLKRVREKEVKEQVAKESDILKTVIEKEIEDNTIPEKEEAIEPTQKKLNTNREYNTFNKKRRH